MNRTYLTIAALAAAAIGTGALTATAGEPKPPATVKLTADVDSANVVDNGAEGDSPGDILTFTQKLTDAKGKSLGTSSASCVTTVVAKYRECQGTFDLPGGQVYITGPEQEAVKKHTLAIVGGSKAYSDARGHITITHKSPTQDGMVFTFKR